MSQCHVKMVTTYHAQQYPMQVYDQSPFLHSDERHWFPMIGCKLDQAVSFICHDSPLGMSEKLDPLTHVIQYVYTGGRAHRFIHLDL